MLPPELELPSLGPPSREAADQPSQTTVDLEWRRTDGGIDVPSGEVGAEALVRGVPACECTE